MKPSQVTPEPAIAFLLVWLSSTVHCQYNSYGGPPYFGEPQPFFPMFPPTRPDSPQLFPPVNSNINSNFLNPFLTGQGQGQANQQQLLQQQLQGSYPNLPSVPFQTVTPNNPYPPKPNNPSIQPTNRYPFLNPSNNLGNLGNINIDAFRNNQQQQQSFGNTLLTQQYPKLPQFPFQTISPSQIPPIDRIYNPPANYPQKPKISLPRIRVIEFPSSEYFEYGGGKLVRPRRPNADLYVGGTGGDVPVTSRIFIECTGPNQVQWIFNGTSRVKDLSVVTKNVQVTIPEDRVQPSGSGEYTYLRLGLDEQISEKDSGVYICRDRILPQNYISIRVLVAKSSQGTGRPTYPFRPKDPNTIYYSRSDNTVLLPCKIEDSQATISLHKYEGGKLSCPYSMDGRVAYDRYKGFTIQTRAFNNLDGRYVCVGDFNNELKLMKYTIAQTDDFQTRYVDGEAQNIIALDDRKKSPEGDIITSAGSSSSSFLAPDASFSKSVFSGITVGNLTGAGVIDPRSEFDIKTAESSVPVPNNYNFNSGSYSSSNSKDSSDSSDKL